MNHVSTTTNRATAEDFNRWTEYARKCSDSQLEYARSDAEKASIAMGDWNPVKRDYYIDEYLTYAQEQRTRRLNRQR